ncbi:MAG: hypothetical protein M0Z38_07770 [Deltaproteobacteria bacterium]|nr:hypothetical protein [Deltaproteobacteria bacterium]
MNKAVRVLLFLLALSGTCAGDTAGHRLIESTAASVNGEVIFLSDLAREACFYRCGMTPGEPARELSLAGAREKLIADVLVLQEQRKLGLGGQDNAAMAKAVAEAATRKAECSSPCASALTDEETRDFIRRRILAREFLEKRVAVFIEVNDEEARREIVRRTRAGAAQGDLQEEKVRKDLFEEKVANGVQSWFDRAASKSRIVLSPMKEP